MELSWATLKNAVIPACEVLYSSEYFDPGLIAPIPGGVVVTQQRVSCIIQFVWP